MTTETKASKNSGSTRSSAGSSSGSSTEKTTGNKPRKSAAGKSSKHWTESELKRLRDDAVIAEIFADDKRGQADLLAAHFPNRTVDAVRCKLWRLSK